MRSVGVMAITLSTAPAAMPARRPRAGDNVPSPSEIAFLIESNVRNRTPALHAVP